MVYAHLEESVLTANVSLLVKPTDSVFTPVVSALEGRCFTVQHSDVIENEMLWGLQGRYWEIQIHGACPDDLHVCKYQRPDIGAALGMV